MTKKNQFLKVCNKQEKHQYKVVISIISSYFKQAEHFYLCTNSKLYMKFIVCGHITSNILNRDVEMISAHFDMSLQKSSAVKNDFNDDSVIFSLLVTQSAQKKTLTYSMQPLWYYLLVALFWQVKMSAVKKKWKRIFYSG